MNKRKYIRFSEEKSSVIQLQFNHPDIEKKGFMPALVIDQNYNSIACLFCYHQFDNNNITELLWKETDSITTPCKIVRIEYLDTSVYKVIFTFA
ncbi:hypothetical protein OAA91_01635 [Fibrobacterales bacterium]|nr:hypothetical protein [Fibrobacterales bacterium]